MSASDQPITEKLTSKKPANSQHDPLQDDPLDRLLSISARTPVSPTFVQDTLRRVRLEANKPTSRLAVASWRRFFQQKPNILFGSLVASLACLAAVFWLGQVPSPDPAHQLAIQESPGDQSIDFQDQLREEFILVALDHPDLFCDSELIALLD